MALFDLMRILWKCVPRFSILCISPHRLRNTTQQVRGQTKVEFYAKRHIESFHSSFHENWHLNTTFPFTIPPRHLSYKHSNRKRTNKVVRLFDLLKTVDSMNVYLIVLLSWEEKKKRMRNTVKTKQTEKKMTTTRWRIVKNKVSVWKNEVINTVDVTGLTCTANTGSECRYFFVCCFFVSFLFFVFLLNFVCCHRRIF